MSTVETYRTKHGATARVEWREHDAVLTIRPGSAEQARRTLSHEQVEDAIAIGFLRPTARKAP